MFKVMLKYTFEMNGIVLAGGTGSRLWPVTWGASKQLLHVYDKPLIHYPISILMLAGIRSILIITTKEDQASFKRLLGDGSRYGISFSYEIQENPDGLAQAFIIGQKFIGDGPCALVLGDNLFHGEGLGQKLKGLTSNSGAHIFAYSVQDPKRYGVLEFDKKGNILSIEEKPEKPKTSLAISGLYFFDNQVVEFAKRVKPSPRGELEITSVLQQYLDIGQLSATILDRGTVWLDTGTFESFHHASSYVQVVQERQGLKISCLEEISWRNKWISDYDIEKLILEYKSSPFADYLRSLTK